ncbi:BRO1-like domain-containing protein [Ditylenchus destructor]|uniref:BRO1-like domain-containing protein n=1 Tax=Ditylenchus destructor TaxID=166010 RepID=A0AAD4QVY1_9BILA|nr:BRO1-like domain-containing protein [Ditylenchus destructor]
MDGIPRVPMIAPEIKVADGPLPDNFAEKLRVHIVTNYQDDPRKYANSFTELNSMRTRFTRTVPVDVELICLMKRYYAQMIGVKKRFPMEENDFLAVPFSWADRALDMPNSLTFEDINFELCCIMFNIGSAHAIIAANEERKDLDSIKNAFTHFQCAAYPIQFLRDQMGCGRYTASPDFENSLLTFYLNILLAQAQECILEKSMIDQRKPLVIARIAYHLHEVYKSCLHHLDTSPVAEFISHGKYRNWSGLCSVKMELYGALGYFYMGQKAEDDKKFGLRLAYFAHALTLIKSACKTAGKECSADLAESVKFAYDVIFQREGNARRENDFIYHERPPKPEELEIEGVVLVKPISFDPTDPSVAGEDLFKSLLPIDVVKSISLYDEEKSKFKREVLSHVENKDRELENYLISLQLDQLHLDEPFDRVRLPDELLQCSAAFSTQPDSLPNLLQKFDRVTSMSSEAEKKLSDLSHRLKKLEDPTLSKDEGFRTISAKIEELYSHHQKAKANNAELQRAMASHSGNLKMLAMPLNELTRYVCGEYVDPMEHDEGKNLRKILSKVDEMRQQRSKFIQTLSEDLERDEIDRKALAERDLDPAKLFERELKKHTKIVDLTKQNLSAQDNILKALTEANANFAEFRRQIFESNEQRALQSLTIVTAFQVFNDVVDKTDKALQFYSQLTTLVSALSQGVENIEAIKEKERQEKERLVAEKRNAMEAANTLKEFAFAPGSDVSHNVSKPQQTNPQDPNIDPTRRNESVTGQTRRPRLGDYMSYYRNKISGETTGGAPAPTEQYSPQTQIYNPAPHSNEFLPSGYPGQISAAQMYTQNPVPPPHYKPRAPQIDTMAHGTVTSQVPSPLPHSQAFSASTIPRPYQTDMPQNTVISHSGDMTPQPPYSAYGNSTNHQITSAVYPPQVLTPGMNSTSCTQFTPAMSHQQQLPPQNQTPFRAPPQIPHQTNYSTQIPSRMPPQPPTIPASHQNRPPQLYAQISGSSQDQMAQIPGMNQSHDQLQSNIGSHQYFGSQATTIPPPTSPAPTTVTSAIPTAYSHASQAPTHGMSSGLHTPTSNPVSAANSTPSPWHQNVSRTNPYATHSRLNNVDVNTQVFSSAQMPIPASIPNSQSLISNTVSQAAVSANISGMLQNQPNLAQNPHISTPQAVSQTNQLIMTGFETYSTISRPTNTTETYQQSSTNLPSNIPQTPSRIPSGQLQPTNTETPQAWPQSDICAPTLTKIPTIGDPKTTDPLQQSQAPNDEITSNAMGLISNFQEAEPHKSAFTEVKPIHKPDTSVNVPPGSQMSYMNPASMPRPAATVLPITRQQEQPQTLAAVPNADFGSQNRVGQTVTSIPDFLSQHPKNAPISGFQSTEQMAAQRTESRPSVNLADLLDPTKFEIGEGDKYKLQKQTLRKEFRNNGPEAKLPELDPNDPLNSLDPKYWLSKQ